MSQTVQNLVKEPGADTAQHYRERVSLLAATYATLFVGSLVGIVLLVWKAQLFVALAQRSNVETLLLAFLMVFFLYLALISAKGAFGALRIAGFALQARLTRDRIAVERRKLAALGPSTERPTVVELNVVLERADRPGEPFEVVLRDAAGEMGRIRVDGARALYYPAAADGSNEVLAFFARQVTDLLGRRGADHVVDIVFWKRIDDEAAEQYHGLVEFARNLGRALGQDGLWPTARLDLRDLRELERRLAEICPAVRDESFLPHWDYQGEHKVPIIPEPLGLLSLSRTERRVDPISSMGCAVLVVLAVVAVLALFSFLPPWVPGR